MTSKREDDKSWEAGTTRRWSRRRFLEVAGAAAAGLLISGCIPQAEGPTGWDVPAEDTPEPTAALSSSPVAEATAQPTSAPAAVEESSAVGPGVRSKVAVASARDYDRQTIENALRDMLDDLGGLSDVVRPGDRVAIKVNLTGGLGNQGPPGFSPMESFVTHPETIRALGGFVRDAGAKEVYIVEAVYQWGSYVEWGLDDIVGDIDAQLIDLNATDPYTEFLDAPVPGGSEMYQTYKINPLLLEVDAFMSVAKMKCHNVAGVTHSLKNLFGLVPARFYQLSSQHSHRSAFHGPTAETAGQRVPRIIVELNRLRPVNFALVDGIMTSEGGEGPWINGFHSITPGVLFAGKDPVATDAVATAAQGFDPAAPGYSEPFVNGDNHLALAAAAGLGTNRLSDIEVLGPSIDDIATKFRPSY